MWVSRSARGCGTTAVLLLWSEALDKGYAAPMRITYKQATTLGAQVHKGEHGSLAVYADSFTKTETDDQGKEADRKIPLMKGDTVFNVEQIDGLPAHYTAKAEPAQPVERIDQVEAIFTATGATIRHDGNQAFYAPSLADQLRAEQPAGRPPARDGRAAAAPGAGLPAAAARSGGGAEPAVAVRNQNETRARSPNTQSVSVLKFSAGSTISCTSGVIAKLGVTWKR